MPGAVLGDRHVGAPHFRPSWSRPFRMAVACIRSGSYRRLVFNHIINGGPDGRPIEIESGWIEDVIEFCVRDENVWPVSHEQSLIGHLGGFRSRVGGLLTNGYLLL